MSRRWSIENHGDGMKIRVRRAPAWLGALGTLVPAGVFVAALVTLLWQTRSIGAHGYVIIMSALSVIRSARSWGRSSDTLHLLNDGVLLRLDGAGVDPDAGLCVRIDDNATVRAHGPAPGWALQELTGLAAVPRVSVRNGGQRVSFGVGLSADDADELVARLAAAPAVRAARDAAPPPVVEMRRTRGALGGRGHEGLDETRHAGPALDPVARTPWSVKIGTADLFVLGASILTVAYALYATQMGTTVLASLGVLGLVTTIPALLRLSRTLFSGRTTAQVLHEPARPGKDVTIRFSLDHHSPVFEWLDVRLQYVRLEQVTGPTWRSWGQRYHTRIVWEGLYRLPEGRLPPGPDEHIDAVFALPADAPPTPAHRKLREHWRLEVTGRTEHGSYDEWFRVLVLPATRSDRGADVTA